MLFFISTILLTELRTALAIDHADDGLMKMAIFKLSHKSNRVIIWFKQFYSLFEKQSTEEKQVISHSIQSFS